MGKEIEKIALQKNHIINAVLDRQEDWVNYLREIVSSDVIIDFSQPEVVVSNIQMAFKYDIPICVGTTGWDKNKEEIMKLCLATNQSILVASNFSIGVNIFFEVNKLLAKFMDHYPEYNATIEEIHHTEKLDKPSGTAIELANQIIDKLNRKNEWSLDKEEKSSDLSIIAKRIADTPGTHQVTYTSPIDQIEIKHTANSRQGFATGAVMAAEWIIGKKGVFGMKDLLGIN